VSGIILFTGESKMKIPSTTLEALDQIHELLSAAARDLSSFIEAPHEYDPAEFMEPVMTVVLDAHLLVTWVKDQQGEGK
jgi:hypothetical protein